MTPSQSNNNAQGPDASGAPAMEPLFVTIRPFLWPWCLRAPFLRREHAQRQAALHPSAWLALQNRDAAAAALKLADENVLRTLSTRVEDCEGGWR
eukprot:CAMPEP_0178444956 /NCGR_PEP_ID=MMETSP0689_2-20121128/39858_1 /TAXON_ID=160604 /ORGANISM="Amphidinium massartii, Strain CS-259" /LENGTH=94 /DNA_ID=CAMNT_0020069371 /DNA_START=534 /DNA_END=814 /DNA_ORIENTATION=+